MLARNHRRSGQRPAEQPRTRPGWVPVRGPLPLWAQCSGPCWPGGAGDACYGAGNLDGAFTYFSAVELSGIDPITGSTEGGDVVTIVLGNSGVHGQMVVRHRSLDVARGTMRISGEAELS